MGLRDIVRAARVRELPVASASIHLDLNTPEELAKVE
jgi:CTP:molybdopterin cytidylyltransferase MocA